MAYMLRQRLTNKTSLSGTPTWRYKLPSVGRYTAIELAVNCNRYAQRATNNLVYPLETQISKVELLEGASRALLSLTAQQIDACNYWDFKKPTARRYRQHAATGNMINLFLMGGRGLYDREYGFDFAKLDETYLEYTHSLSADTAEKFDVSDHEVSVYGWRWMGGDAPSFKGYRRIRQLAQWTTTGTSALKTIEIPLGAPIRRIGVQGKTRASTIGGTFTKMEVRVNDGEYSPVTINSPMQWTMQEVDDYGLNNEVGGIEVAIHSVTTDLPSWFSYYQTVMATMYPGNPAGVIGTSGITIPAGLYNHWTTALECMFTVRGWGFQKCLRIGFDHDYDGFDLFQTRGLGSLDLELTEAAASKDAAVFVEDLLLY